MRAFAPPLIALSFGLAQCGGDALAQSRVDAQSASTGSAHGYPVRPIRIIVPNTAGSGMDNVTRMIGQRLTEAWGQQIVVDDRPGAGEAAQVPTQCLLSSIGCLLLSQARANAGRPSPGTFAQEIRG